jgi:hypothetical protein
LKFEEKKNNFTFIILMAILDLDTEPGPHYGKLLDRKHGQKIHLTFTTNKKNIFNSVPDPEPDVFGPPVSRIESTTLCTDPDPYLYPSSSNQKTKVKPFL